MYLSRTPGAPLADAGKMERFERVVLCHLDAAYNLARWLTQDEAGAEDALQDACLKAFRFFESQNGPSPRAWFMTVVRNACLDWLKEHRRRAAEEEYDDDVHGGTTGGSEQPEAAAARTADARWLHECMAALPRGVPGGAGIARAGRAFLQGDQRHRGCAHGNGMSRISRGRDLLQERLLEARRRRRS